jgi:hypothetical protein
MAALDIQTKIEEVVTAIEAGDNATALLKLNAAHAILIGTPSVDIDGKKIQFYQDQIDTLRKSLNRSNAASKRPLTGILITRRDS